MNKMRNITLIILLISSILSVNALESPNINVWRVAGSGEIKSLANDVSNGDMLSTDDSKIFVFDMNDKFSFTAVPSPNWEFDKFCSNPSCDNQTQQNPFTGTINQLTGNLYVYFKQSTTSSTDMSQSDIHVWRVEGDGIIKSESNDKSNGNMLPSDSSKTFTFNMNDRYSFTAVPAQGWKFDKFCSDESCNEKTQQNPFTGTITETTGNMYVYFKQSETTIPTPTSTSSPTVTPTSTKTPTPTPTPTVTSTPSLSHEQAQKIADGWSSSSTEQGFLNISSNPTDAKIYINKKYITNTVENGKEIRTNVGTNDILITKDGYKNWTGTATVKYTGVNFILATLESEQSSVPTQTETKENSPVVVPIPENKDKGSASPYIYLFGLILVGITTFCIAWNRETLIKYANIISKNIKATKTELTQNK